MPISKFSFHIVQSLAGQVVSRAIGLVITALLFRAYSTALIGEYILVLAYANIGIMLTKLGQDSGLTQYYLKKKYSAIGPILFYRVLSSVIFLIAGSLVFVFLPPEATPKWFLFPLILLPFLTAISFDWALRAQKKFRQLAVLTVFGQVAGLVFAVLGFLTKEPVFLVLIQLAMTTTLVFFMAKYLSYKTLQKFLITTTEGLWQSWDYIKISFRDNIGFTGISIILVALTNSEVILASQFLSLEEIGEFSALNRLGAFAQAILLVINSVVYVHLLSNTISNRKALAFNVIIGILMALVLAAFPALILNILFGSAFVELGDALRIFAASTISASIFQYFLSRSYLSAREANIWRTLAAMTGVMLIIAVGAYAIQLYGFLGMIVFTSVKWLLGSLLLKAVFLRKGHSTTVRDT